MMIVSTNGQVYSTAEDLCRWDLWLSTQARVPTPLYEMMHDQGDEFCRSIQNEEMCI